MRKELEYRKADSGKIEQAKDLIGQIASGGMMPGSLIKCWLQ